MLLCDVICENLPYGGINIVDPDQTLCVMRDVWSGPTRLIAYEHIQRTFSSLPVQFYRKSVKAADLG